MKILMIYPEFPITFWSYKHALNLINIKSLLQPLGFQTIAALFPTEWERRLVDLNVTELFDADLEWADYVFISAMAIQEESVKKIISRCKELEVKIVAGGPLFTGEYEQFDDVDHFILNEAELTLPPFISDIEQNTLKRIYSTSEFFDLGKSQVPQWDIIDMDQYAIMGVQYSRGCPFKCEFCNITVLLGHQMRLKSADHIIAELDSIYKIGWRKPIFFVDDNFIGNRSRLKAELLPLLIEWHKEHPEITFRTQVSINIADDDELIHLMVEAGFKNVFIGIETPDVAGLTECTKKQNKNRNLIENVKHIHNSGLMVEAGFIVGFDSDTLDIFQRQIDFIQESGIVTAMVGMLQAPVGTKLYERLKREGRLLGRISGDNVDGSTNIIPKMGLEALIEGYKKILEYIYSPEHYTQRVKTFLQDFNRVKGVGNKKVKLSGMLIRLVYQLGVVDCDRKYFWKLILWTLSHRRGLLLLAIGQAVAGYHFRRVCKANLLKSG